MVALTDKTTAASMVESTAVLTVARKVAMMDDLKADIKACAMVDSTAVLMAVQMAA